MSYYKTINGKKLDNKIIDQANLLVEGAGDGRISNNDAKVLLNLVLDSNVITDVAKDTIEYIFENFRWTSSAEEWFRNELIIWQSHKDPVPLTIADLFDKHFATTDVLTDPEAKAARKHALESATSETNQDHDEIGLWIRLKDGLTVEVFSNFISLENDFVQLKGGCIIPVKAIEKVEI